MKEFIHSKIQEARDAGRDIDRVLEEILLHIAGALEGEKPHKVPPAKHELHGKPGHHAGAKHRHANDED